MDASYFVTTTEYLEERLSKISLDNPNHINLVITSIEKLVQDFVIPAMKVCPIHQDSIYTFNLDEIAKTEVIGLMLSYFENNINELNKPNDQELNELLTKIGITNTNQEQRDKFFVGWAGEKAIESIIRLTKFLSPKKLDNQKISDLLKFNLPNVVRSNLQSILN